MVFMGKSQEIHTTERRESSEKHAAGWVEDEMMGCQFADVRHGKRLRQLFVAVLQASGRHDTLGIAGLGVIEGGIPLFLERSRERSGDSGGAFSGHPQPRCQGWLSDPDSSGYDRVQL